MNEKSPFEIPTAVAHLTAQNLVLKAHLSTLTQTFFAYMDVHSPESYEKLKKGYPLILEERLESLLVEHHQYGQILGDLIKKDLQDIEGLFG